MRKVLNENFFNRDTKTVAQELLGKFLVRRIGKRDITVMITQTEAYDGLRDKASHASKGKTKRTQVMFGQPGVFYVYLVYGMHYMLNVVTRAPGYPAAVLIRGVSFTNSIELVNEKNMGKAAKKDFLNGPAKLTKFLQINKKLNAEKAQKSSGLWFEDRGVIIPPRKIKKTARIGVDYAGPIWSAKKWRFLLY